MENNKISHRQAYPNMPESMRARLTKSDLQHYANGFNAAQSGGFAPIINKAATEKSVLFPPDWEVEFDKKFYIQDQYGHTDLLFLSHIRQDLLNFIQSQITKAREEEAKSCNEALSVMNSIYNEEIKIERFQLINQIVELLEGTKVNLPTEQGVELIDSYNSPRNQALTDAIKLIKEIK